MLYYNLFYMNIIVCGVNKILKSRIDTGFHVLGDTCLSIIWLTYGTKLYIAVCVDVFSVTVVVL